MFYSFLNTLLFLFLIINCFCFYYSNFYMNACYLFVENIYNVNIGIKLTLGAFINIIEKH